VPELAGAEPRLGRRYHRLVLSQFRSADPLAAGNHGLPATTQSFAATQAAWRFYANASLTMPDLVGPLLEHVRRADACDDYQLVALDWSLLHFNSHGSKSDRVALSRTDDRGYELLTALAISDRDGAPIAPVCLELRAAAGVYSTRSEQVLKPSSSLDGLLPVMNSLPQGPKPPVFIIDREADSVGHYRQWSEAGKRFVVRAKDNPRVIYQGQSLALQRVADQLPLRFAREVLYHGKTARQSIAETTVTLVRPARPKRKSKGKTRKRKSIPGAALTLRLIVAQVSDAQGNPLARWLLLSNLSSDVNTATLALWYYWRWRIESYHKLLKSAGQHLEQWQQESAPALCRRLLVVAMSVALTWHIARDPTPGGQQLRATLVRLSGRQIKRTPTARRFTEPALLAGLCVLMPMLVLLEQTPLEQLRELASPLLSLIKTLEPPAKPRDG
jgi:hypothetical protein